MGEHTKPRLRSSEWFNNPDNLEMTALYLERYLNLGMTREELQSGKPVLIYRRATGIMWNWQSGCVTALSRRAVCP